ncbi:MAG: HPF/RaiA family ribosome-associated protein [Gemmatimonadetes bacterium]|nr:HPF/RaiA family ribosome-associated protein [Gemmatimonadota bacterium]
MQVALEISGHGHRPTAHEEGAIEREVARLGAYYGCLLDCHVTLSVPYRHSNGEPGAWSFRLALVVPGGELAVARPARSHFDAALRDAFEAAARQLDEFLRERQAGTML